MRCFVTAFPLLFNEVKAVMDGEDELIAGVDCLRLDDSRLDDLLRQCSEARLDSIPKDSKKIIDNITLMLNALICLQNRFLIYCEGRSPFEREQAKMCDWGAQAVCNKVMQFISGESEKSSYKIPVNMPLLQKVHWLLKILLDGYLNFDCQQSFLSSSALVSLYDSPIAPALVLLNCLA